MSMKKYLGHCVGQVGVPAIHNVIVETVIQFKASTVP